MPEEVPERSSIGYKYTAAIVKKRYITLEKSYIIHTSGYP